MAAVFRCTQCHRGTVNAPAPGATDAHCPACHAAFGVEDGVLDLLGGPSARRTVAQRAMESTPIVRIYESRLWRRSPLFAAMTGIGFDAEQELILRALSLEGGETVLDLACGPGIYARPIARQVPRGQVVGLDLSKPMLRYAAKRAGEEGLGNLTFVRADALDLPFADGGVHRVNCCGALHLFPDVTRALSEVSRVLAPGGRATLAVFRGGERRRLAARAARAAGIDSFSRETLTALLQGAGLSEVECFHDQALWLMARARKRAA